MSLLTPRENRTLTNYLIKKSRNAMYTAESGKEKSPLTKQPGIFEERERALGGSAERITHRPTVNKNPMNKSTMGAGTRVSLNPIERRNSFSMSMRSK